MDLTVAKQGGNSNNNNSMVRDYRKGNWNLEETMVLIEAKKMDDERRMRRFGGDQITDRCNKPAELRWKWVEDYCWKNGCLRSQNQCNDKWDNLMRDFKKIREYERRIMADDRSYWRIEKNERKDNNLPSNMLVQIYEALVEVVERKSPRVATAADGGAVGGTSVGLPPAVVVVEKSGGGSRVSGHHQFSVVQPIVEQYAIAYQAPAPAEAEAPGGGGGGGPSSHQPLPTVDSDTNENSGSSAKRRKRRGDDDGREGTGGGGGGTIQELGSAISKSAATIAEAIQTCEEREERRHRELLSVHERRLKIEESKAEINRQAINGLVDAINNLANSIFALASNNNNQSPSK